MTNVLINICGNSARENSLCTNNIHDFYIIIQSQIAMCDMFIDF